MAPEIMDTFEALVKTMPGIARQIEQIYTLMRCALSMQPAGRRALAAALGRGEREVRTDTDFLRSNFLIRTTPSGMYLTEAGYAAADRLNEILHSMNGMYEKEKKYSRKWDCDIHISACGSVADPEIMKTDIALLALSASLEREEKIWTAECCEFFTKAVKAIPICKFSDMTVVNARAGNKAASKGCSELAKRLGAASAGTDLVLPSQQSELVKYIESSKVTEYTETVNSTKLVMAHINRAQEAMIRAGLSHRMINILLDQGAEAELLGYYLRADGKVIYIASPLTVSLDTLSNADMILTAYGKESAKAASAVLSRFTGAELFTDAACADNMGK